MSPIPFEYSLVMIVGSVITLLAFQFGRNVQAARDADPYLQLLKAEKDAMVERLNEEKFYLEQSRQEFLEEIKRCKTNATST